MNVVYFLLTSEASDEMRRKFNAEVGLVDDTPIYDPRLPEHIRDQIGDRPVPAFYKQAGGVDPAVWAANL